MAPEPPSPSASSVLLPFLGGRSRRGSLASITSRRGEIDKDALAQALDTIHTTASRSEALTSFHDFDGGGPKSSVPKDTTGRGVSGLYNRFKHSVSGATSRDSSSTAQKGQSKESVVESTPSVNKSVTKHISGPDTASLQSVSVTASPTPSATRNGIDPRNSGNKDVRNVPAKNDNTSIRDFESSRDDSREGSREPSRRSLAEIQRGTAANEALSRVMSLSEARGERDESKTPALRFADGNESAVVDDSEDEEELHQQPKPAGGPHSPRLVGHQPSRGEARTADMPQRPPLPHVGLSHLPGFKASRASSTTDGAERASTSSKLTAQRSPALQPSPNLNSALQRKRTGGVKPPGAFPQAVSVSTNLRRRVISKEFWMKDENAKDCFSCGQTFSTFRRKHHCRTCGQIFDAKCTTLVQGRPFGQPGTLRLCKPCEAMIFDDDDDDSTVFTDDGEESIVRSPVIRRSQGDKDGHVFDGAVLSRHATEVATPTMGIPASRRNRESKRRSAVIEFDAMPPPLARPSSSHSLISLSRRPRSSSHRRHNSRYNPMRGLRNSNDWGPFHQQNTPAAHGKESNLPAFHNDNVIDPDLAPFLSDDGSDEDEHQSILGTIEQASSPAERERLGFSGLFSSSVRKGRSRGGDRPANGTPGTKSSVSRLRTRNASIGSMSIGKASPKLSNGHGLLRSFANGAGQDEITSAPERIGSAIVPSSAMHAPPMELNMASLEHVRRLLSQMLQDVQITPTAAWTKALIPILLQCTDGVDPDVQQGDDMDIRHYIKMKKVPGGRPGDTSYVSGIVFSKNVALKSMSTSIRHPRIAIVTFAIEYARPEQHFLSLEPVIAQEREYLRSLVARIAALRPQLLLVQRHVSGLALQLLDEAGITVVHNINPSVLAAVARVTQTPMIKSVDKLAIDPAHLGQCGSFEVKTYLHNDIRKTYIFLCGCLPELGCTIVLRGGSNKTLRTIKRITEFMCYVVYNLKLETYLMRDEFISIPSTRHDPLAAHDLPGPFNKIPRSTILTQRDLTAEIERSRTSTLSKYAELEEKCRKRVLSASPFVVFMQPYILTQLREQETRLATYKLLRDQYAEANEDEGETDDNDTVIGSFDLVRPEMVHAPPSKEQPKAVREYLHAVHEAQLEKTTHSYETQKRLWESFTDSETSPFDPMSHQIIVILHSTVSSATNTPCYGPSLIGIEFYTAYPHVRPNFSEDCTLGQYVEDLCANANSKCDNCQKRMYAHHRQYVHGYGQVLISIQRQPAKMKGYEDRIHMWSSCRTCRAETAVIPMSENTWKYSFAKYLELSFWSSPLHPRANLCQHDIHKDFLRCFELGEMVVKVQYDPIEIYDIVVPRATITWRVETDLTMKNDQYTLLETKLKAFVESVRKRLDSITLDTLEEKKQYEANDTLNELRQRIEDDERELSEKLQRKYATSRYYELLPLNRALRFMDEKALEWDEAFAAFESDFFPSEHDIRKLAVLQLKNMFLESQPASVSGGDVSDVDETPEKPEKSASRPEELEVLEDEKARDVLSSSIEAAQYTAPNGSAPTTDDSPLGVSLTQKMSPREQHELAVDREDVRHLDLAVPSLSGEESTTEHRTAEMSPSPPKRTGILSDDSPVAAQPKPLSHGLLEKIEQIRSKRVVDADTSESKIPRPVKPPPATTRPSTLLRAKSQPVHVPRLSVDSQPDQSVEDIPESPPAGEAPFSIDKRLSERLGVARLAQKVGKVAPSFIPRSIPQRNQDDSVTSSVSALARHFEQLSREFENQRLKERRHKGFRSRQFRGGTTASSRPVVEVYRNAAEAVGDSAAEKKREEAKDGGRPTDADQDFARFPPAVSSDETLAEAQGSQTRQGLAKEDEHRPQATLPDHTASAQADKESQNTSQELQDPMSETASTNSEAPGSFPEMELPPELSIPEHKKNVWFKYLAEFWSKRSASGWTNLAYPLGNTEHVFEDADIIVREDEPSSVVALALACADYQSKVKLFRSNATKTPAKHAHSNSQTSNVTTEGNVQQSAVEASLLSDTGTHLKYSFTHNQVRATCKIFYAEAFDALRRKCGVADRFVESLSRCLKYDSKGGKTKSIFLKTIDGRFIIKSLQEVELKAFTKFAPDYFSFMSYTLFHGVPSVIAKMFGVFQVTIKNPATGLDFSYHLLVMENLFYERNPTRRFDLKGSMRNRKIESTGQPDEVLLDENLVESIFESPLFVREHARKLMQASVHNDTMWLCKQNVMDYSLMAGFDDERKELIVGIIDCIRTYTWDKKLESWIKDRGKNKPTITSPKDYRNRFRVSMMQYVLQAPNCWHQFQSNMQAPKTLKDREESGLGNGSVEQDGDTDFERERRSEAT